MNEYQGTFQHPMSGDIVEVHFDPEAGLADFQPVQLEDEDVPVHDDVIDWCDKHRGRRFRDVKALRDFLIGTGVPDDDAYDVVPWDTDVDGYLCACGRTFPTDDEIQEHMLTARSPHIAHYEV